MLTKVAASLCLVGLCSAQLSWMIKSRRREAGRLAIAAPSVIFIGGILARFGIGSLLLSITPEELVLDGEYRQYIVSWLYSGEAAELWIGYIFCGGVTFGLLEGFMKVKRKSRSVDIQREGWFGWVQRVRTIRSNEDRLVKVVTATIICIFFAGSCISAWTGSMDRGSSYNYWAGLTFRPEAALIAFSRLKQIGYFLLPITWIHASWRLRSLLIFGSVSPLIIEAVGGGRGAVLYPVIMLFAGYLCVCLRYKRMWLYGSLLIALLAIGVPYMAAYRDGDAIKTISHRDIGSRLTSFITGVERDRITYRYMALGREVYACSDGFILEDTRRGNRTRIGLGDLGLGELKKIVMPRWLAKDQRYEKADGASIAKGLMGIEKRNWFPCVTTPADLFRRDRWTGVVAGGALIGAILWVLDVMWLRVGNKVKDVDTLLLTILPVTYVQAGIYGTVRELIWQLVWELPKYIVLFWAIRRGLEVNRLLSRHAKR